jgi:hypothetical protein
MGRLARVELLIFYVRHPVRDPVHHVPVVLFKPRLALFGHGVALLPSPAGGEAAADADAARVPRGHDTKNRWASLATRGGAFCAKKGEPGRGSRVAPQPAVIGRALPSKRQRHQTNSPTSGGVQKISTRTFCLRYFWSEAQRSGVTGSCSVARKRPQTAAPRGPGLSLGKR